MGQTMLDDINALSDLLIGVNVGSKAVKGHVPKTYNNEVFSIDYLRGGSETYNGTYYRVNRTYRLVVTGANPPEILTRIGRAQDVLSSQVKFPIQGGFLTIGDRVSFSEIFLSEEKGTYLSIGIIEGYTNRVRPQEEYGVITDVGITTINGEGV